MDTDTDELLTCAQVALRLRGSVQVHHVRLWCDRNLLPHALAGANGKIRIVRGRDLPRARELARARGLLDDEPAPTNK